MYQFIICKITCISFFNNNRCKGFNYHLDKTYQECSPLKPIWSGKKPNKLYILVSVVSISMLANILILIYQNQYNRFTLPFAQTTTVNDLSNHLSYPLPCSIEWPNLSNFEGSSCYWIIKHKLTGNIMPRRCPVKTLTFVNRQIPLKQEISYTSYLRIISMLCIVIYKSFLYWIYWTFYCY